MIGRLLCWLDLHHWVIFDYGSGWGFDRFYRYCSRCDARSHFDSSEWHPHTQDKTRWL